MSSRERTSRPRTISFARMLAFSGGEIGTPGWPASNVHTDLAKAKRAGLQNTIASGIQAEGYLIAMIVDELGEGWLSGGTLSVKHVGMLSPGDVVISKLKNGMQGTSRLELQCERPDGKVVVAGEADSGSDPNKVEPGRIGVRPRITAATRGPAAGVGPRGPARRRRRRGASRADFRRRP
jgi:hypothetical protein